MTWTVVASEYANAGMIFSIVCLCVAFSAIVGRWWTLVLPVALAAAVFALSLVDAFYERTPEDMQAAVVFGATYGLALPAVALALRRFATAAIARRRKPHTR